MRTFLFVLLIVLSGWANAQERSRFQVLHKGDVFHTPLSRMVVMDDRTFGQFYFYRAQFDSLSRKVITFQHLYDELDSLNRNKVVILNELIAEKDRQVLAGQQAYREMKATAEMSLAETEDCLSQYNALQRQYHRQARRNKFWKTATCLLAGVALTVIIL